MTPGEPGSRSLLVITPGDNQNLRVGTGVNPDPNEHGWALPFAWTGQPPKSGEFLDYDYLTSPPNSRSQARQKAQWRREQRKDPRLGK